MDLAFRSSRYLLQLGFVALVFALGACGSGGGGPTAPDLVASASIGGVVDSGSAGSGSNSPLTGVTVSVQGTNLAVTTDGQGRFSLAGVPAGDRMLSFEQSGQIAELLIAGVKPGEHIQLVVALAGSSVEIQSIDRGGPGTGQPAVALEKSTNGKDADTAPGPSIPVGDPVAWEYVVSNIGNVELTDIEVTDDQGVPVICPATALRAGGSMTCTGTGSALEGQYANLGTVRAADADGTPVRDEDPSHYFGEASGGGDFTVQIQPDTWNTNWIGSSGTVSAKIQGGDLIAIDVSSIVLFEGDPLAAVAPVGVPGITGNHLRARFAKSAAFMMLADPQTGETRFVTVRFVAAGALVDLPAEIRIVGPAL